KPDLKGIEINKEVTVTVINAAMGFVRDDEVKEPGIEVFEALHHGRVRGKVDAFCQVLVGCARDVNRRGPGKEFLEDIIGLLAQFATVTEEEDALCPFGPDQEITQGHRHASLTCARGLDEKRLPFSGVKAFADALNRFYLVKAINDEGGR